MKSSYPFGSYINLELLHHYRIPQTHIRHYDVICSCIMLLMPNAGKYKWLLKGKGSQIKINNNTNTSALIYPLSYPLSFIVQFIAETLNKQLSQTKLHLKCHVRH